MFWRLVYDLLASGEWWDTIPADSDRWGARKFTIGPNGSRKRPRKSSLFYSLFGVSVAQFSHRSRLMHATPTHGGCGSRARSLSMTVYSRGDPKGRSKLAFNVLPHREVTS